MALKDLKTMNYNELNDELEKVIGDLQSPSIDVDKAIADYKRGIELVDRLETHLKRAENTVYALKPSKPNKK